MTDKTKPYLSQTEQIILMNANETIRKIWVHKGRQDAQKEYELFLAESRQKGRDSMRDEDKIWVYMWLMNAIENKEIIIKKDFVIEQLETYFDAKFGDKK